MVRPKIDPNKVVSIIRILGKYPEGVWVRRIAKEANLNHKTISRYLIGPLNTLVEVSDLGSTEGKPLLKIVRLKPAVLDRLQQGSTIKQVIRLAGLIERVRK